MNDELTEASIEALRAADAEEPVRKSAPKKKKATTGTYRNTTTNNIFTSAGKCGPGKTITLSTKEAGDYAGLEKV